MSIEIKNERQLRALTGISEKQYDILLDAFTKNYEEKKWTDYQKGLEEGKRRRQPGGGRKSGLATASEKLTFLLYYLKVYPTFDVLGTQFKLSRSKAHENLHKLLPIFYQSLVSLEVMPYREFSSPTELAQALKETERIFVDVTERNHNRPEEEPEQQAYYSGKKKDIQ